MNDTAAKLIAVGAELFAQHGYDATSVRAVTSKAGANLGAITYHFGTKEEFYGAVLASVAQPAREYLLEAVAGGGTPLARIERFIRALFDYLRDHPGFPRLIMHHLAGARPPPAALRHVIHGNFQTLVGLISEGQQDGSIRSGDPRLMAPSVVSQPIYITLARQLLQEGTGIDLNERETREALVNSVVAFVRAGLATPQGGVS